MADDPLEFGTGVCKECKMPFDNHGLAHWPHIICPATAKIPPYKTLEDDAVWGQGKPATYFTFKLPELDEPQSSHPLGDLPPGWKYADEAESSLSYDDDGYWYDH